MEISLLLGRVHTAGGLELKSTSRDDAFSGNAGGQ
jgi:hypothetical protein